MTDATDRAYSLLVVGIIAQAKRDGDSIQSAKLAREARYWLESVGRGWCEIVAPDCVCLIDDYLSKPRRYWSVARIPKGQLVLEGIG